VQQFLKITESSGAWEISTSEVLLDVQIIKNNSPGSSRGCAGQALGAQELIVRARNGGAVPLVREISAVFVTITVEAGGNAQSVVAPELTQVTRSEICFFTHRQQKFSKFTEMIKMLKNGESV
jgi:hypothetical protein